MPFSDARGPTHARHLAATLYSNEDYFMQIDSHTTFIQVCCFTEHMQLAYALSQCLALPVKYMADLTLLCRQLGRLRRNSIKSLV